MTSCTLRCERLSRMVPQIQHTMAGFRQLDQARQSLSLGREEVVIGLETAHNLLVDCLWDQGYEQIYVLPPSVVKSAQKRYRRMMPGIRA